MAKVSMRLVPDQDPDKIAQLFEDYVKKIAPKTVELKVTRMHGGKPWMTEFDNPFVQAAGRAIEKGFGKAPVFNREGGSIPVVATFQEILGLPVGAVRRRPARTRTRTPRTRSSISGISTAASLRPRFSMTKSRGYRPNNKTLDRIWGSGLFTISFTPPNLCRNSGGRVTQERRLVPRYRIESTIAVGKGIGRTLDLSSRGVCFETTERLEPGETVAIVFPFERTGPRCLGQVHRLGGARRAPR